MSQALRYLRLTALLASMTLPTWECRADLYNVQLLGTVDNVDPALGGTFSVGQGLTGSYVFDSSTVARAGSNSTFAVFDALKSLNFSMGSYTGSSLGAPEIQIDNNPPSPDVDRYALVARASSGLSGPSVAGNALNTFGIRLDDSTNSVFSTALVLPTNLSLSSFNNRQFFVFFGDLSDPRVVSGTLTGLTFTAVPEPGAFTLAFTGLAVLGASQAIRRRRSAR